MHALHGWLKLTNSIQPLTCPNSYPQFEFLAVLFHVFQDKRTHHLQTATTTRINCVLFFRFPRGPCLVPDTQMRNKLGMNNHCIFFKRPCGIGLPFRSCPWISLRHLIPAMLQAPTFILSQMEPMLFISKMCFGKWTHNLWFINFGCTTCNQENCGYWFHLWVQITKCGASISWHLFLWVMSSLKS